MGVITAILTLVALSVAPAAVLADGDPASDVLVTSRLFDPPDVVDPADEARLDALLAASARAGFRIRVALIGSASDLGTVTQLFDKPGNYAYYLWTELSNLYGGQILVVMPDGYGLYGHGKSAISAAEAAVKAPAPAQGTRLMTAALAAVPLLAAAAGHPIPATDIHAAARIVASSPPTPVTVWIALVIGALLIAAAWMASLRARPVARRRRTAA